MAQELGAKKPVRVPRFIGRMFAGEAGVVMMNEVRGASNAKAKRELGWTLRHPTWREGFAAAYASAVPVAVQRPEHVRGQTGAEAGARPRWAADLQASADGLDAVDQAPNA